MTRFKEADMPVTTAPERAYRLRHAQSWLRGWRLASLLAASGALGMGIVFAWDWLAAGGIFVLFVTVVPCLVLCGLGLSMLDTKGGRDIDDGGRM